MGKFCVYILYSKVIDQYYIGYTENLETRLDQHNQHIFQGAFTKKAEDWEVFHIIECQSIVQALKIEKHIKNNRSRKYLVDLAKYPQISQKLLEKYREL
ncbi:GIY-YIG nuclease family protein [Aquiflexum sp. TKW24L]|uniref:GIY-YIG nuclease family protein n=1 Tax=Aquiflexum sp. TKW24L TaxID=2942212 RepID=UPI0020C0DE44|nr:GIY-YIG nuclease family protein [Aquiflexum sp. TKW24L]MCL6258080.1 GIY-YIG nuclease family protein [Aquiflexum sp. TKW24L]